MNTGPVCEAQTSMPATTLAVVNLGLGAAELLPRTFASTIGAVLHRRPASDSHPGTGLRESGHEIALINSQTLAWTRWRGVQGSPCGYACGSEGLGLVASGVLCEAIAGASNP
jgi:hypothetical protein